MWITHPTLPHSILLDRGNIIARCVRTMCPDRPFVVWRDAVPRPFIAASGATAAEAMAKFDREAVAHA